MIQVPLTHRKSAASTEKKSAEAEFDRCEKRAEEETEREDKQEEKNVRRKSVFRWDPRGENPFEKERQREREREREEKKVKV